MGQAWLHFLTLWSLFGFVYLFAWRCYHLPIFGHSHIGIEWTFHVRHCQHGWCYHYCCWQAFHGQACWLHWSWWNLVSGKRSKSGKSKEQSSSDLYCFYLAALLSLSCTALDTSFMHPLNTLTNLLVPKSFILSATLVFKCWPRWCLLMSQHWDIVHSGLVLWLCLLSLIHGSLVKLPMACYQVVAGVGAMVCLLSWYLLVLHQSLVLCFGVNGKHASWTCYKKSTTPIRTFSSILFVHPRLLSVIWT